MSFSINQGVVMLRPYSLQILRARHTPPDPAPLCYSGGRKQWDFVCNWPAENSPREWGRGTLLCWCKVHSCANFPLKGRVYSGGKGHATNSQLEHDPLGTTASWHKLKKSIGCCNSPWGWHRSFYRAETGSLTAHEHAPVPHKSQCRRQSDPDALYIRGNPGISHLHWDAASVPISEGSKELDTWH